MSPLTGDSNANYIQSHQVSEAAIQILLLPQLMIFRRETLNQFTLLLNNIN